LREALAIADKLLKAGREPEACRIVGEVADALTAGFRWQVDLFAERPFRRVPFGPGMRTDLGGPRLVPVDIGERSLADDLLERARRGR
jgi:hypothetical protein